MWRPKEFCFQLRDETISPKKEIKYLGVTIDKALTFGAHVAAACAKAERVAAALGRVMPNVKGPKQNKRRTMAEAVNSILMYGAPIWSEAMKIQRHRGKVERVQRMMALRIISAYRTVSLEAAQVVAGAIPIHLLVEERRRLFRRGVSSAAEKSEERAQTEDKWQEEWNDCEKGTWTRTLIPDLRPWLRRKHGETDYFVTQFMTGHGSYGAYLQRIGKVEDPTCVHCGREVDTAEHAMFQCERWHRERTEMEAEVGERLSPANIINVALQSYDRWRTVMGKIHEIMQKKETDMRRREDREEG
ncbi:hypothetical protein NQ315_012564 [Exocentrus adspersus]|uniref:Reverse transcriptase n=1 Tax=Exocentrus adspersus TaxID=1586481 RepID=A0AAV8VC54_9CUCU|nr:hypothetical protein NQ315_012564 [Exocentrus adspersus]